MHILISYIFDDIDGTILQEINAMRSLKAFESHIRVRNVRKIRNVVKKLIRPHVLSITNLA